MNEYFKKIVFNLFISTIAFIFLTSSIFSQKKIIIYELSNNNNYKVRYNREIKDSSSYIKKLNEILINDYSKGYAFAGYDSINYNDSIIIAYYSKGEKLLINNLSIDIENDSNKIVNQKWKGEFNKDVLYKYLYKNLEILTNNGYPFAQIILTDFEIKKNKIDIKFKVNKGNYYVFDSIIIKGDARIKEYYIRKYTGLKKGEKFSSNKVKSFERSISTIPFISQERPFQLAFSDSTTDLLLYLKNKKSSSFNGYIGFIPSNLNSGQLSVTGDMNLVMVNTFGYGDYFALKWQKIEKLSQQLQLDLSLPYILKSHFGSGTYFKIEKKDSTFVNTDLILKLIYGSNTGRGIDFVIQTTDSRVLLNISNSNKFKNYKLNLYGINYRFINLDNLSMPREGLNLNFGISVGRKTYSEDVDSIKLLHIKAIADFTTYLPINRFINLKLRNKTSSIISNKISFNELEFLGGLNSIRGFDENSLPATSYSILTTELRYIFDHTSALFVFGDFAYIERRFTVNDSRNLLLGTGIGIELGTNAGIFSLVFALGKHKDQSVNFSSSKIHFGYRNYF